MSKIFGILHLSSRTVYTDEKGNIYKKFTPFISYDSFNSFNIKTKRKSFIDCFCVICPKNKIVLEYFDNCTPDHIPIILTKLYWKKINITDKIIDLTPNRIHLENHISYTIDPIGSLDKDDAIGIDITNNKFYIHIADPTSYIEKNSILDKEIFNRGSSIYLDKIDHMLPEIFSTDIISLLENRINRAYTLEVTVKDFVSCEIISYRFYKSFIKVINLTYEQAEQLLIDNKNIDIVKLYELYKMLSGNNLKDFHKIVEFYMILCNKYVAIELKDSLSIVRDNNIINKPINLNYNSKLIELYNNLSNNETATYKLNTECHNEYTHFSSPIRRYIDNVIHRILFSKNNSLENSYSEEELKYICEHINTINKNYKTAYNINKLNKLLKDNDLLQLDFIIVQFDENLIRIYNEQHDILIFMNIIHPSIKKTIIIYHDKQYEELKIEKNNGEIITFNIFQKIKLKIYKFKNSKQPYKFSIIDPVLDLI
jgi:exoribonuclease R